MKNWKESCINLIIKLIKFLFNPKKKKRTFHDYMLFCVNKFNVFVRKYASLKNLLKVFTLMRIEIGYYVSILKDKEKQNWISSRNPINFNSIVTFFTIFFRLLIENFFYYKNSVYTICVISAHRFVKAIPQGFFTGISFVSRSAGSFFEQVDKFDSPLWPTLTIPHPPIYC